MKSAANPKKDDIIPLDVTQQARHRLLVGLNWEPRELTHGEKATRIWRGVKSAALGDLVLLGHNMRKVGEKMDSQDGREADDMAFDLDLCCYCYDNKGNFLNLIDPDAWNAIDESGKIYHSGENMDGFSGNDDEQIYIELKGLPDTHTDFFFVVKSDCAHKLDSVSGANVRIADSMTNKDFLRIDIQHAENSGNYAYIFAHVYKEGDKWFAHNISEFTDFEQNWSDYLKKYL